MENNRRNDILKIIAMVTMFVDHMGVLYFDGVMIFRTIGRIAFPIFCYQLALGFLHTSNRKKYRSKLLIFGLIAQIPYMLLNPDLIPHYFVFNVILLFWVATFVLELYEKIVKCFDKDNEKGYGVFLSIILFLLIMSPSILQVIWHDFGLSYGTYGLLMILMFYIVGQNAFKIIVGYLIISIIGVTLTGVYYNYLYSDMGYLESFFYIGPIWRNMINYNDGLRNMTVYFFQARSILAIPIIIALEYVKPRFKLDGRVGYYFYPIHITVLVLFRLILQINV